MCDYPRYLRLVQICEISKTLESMSKKKGCEEWNKWIDTMRENNVEEMKEEYFQLIFLGEDRFHYGFDLDQTVDSRIKQIIGKKKINIQSDDHIYDKLCRKYSEIKNIKNPFAKSCMEKQDILHIIVKIYCNAYKILNGYVFSDSEIDEIKHLFSRKLNRVISFSQLCESTRFDLSDAMFFDKLFFGNHGPYCPGINISKTYHATKRVGLMTVQ